MKKHSIFHAVIKLTTMFRFPESLIYFQNDLLFSKIIGVKNGIIKYKKYINIKNLTNSINLDIDSLLYQFLDIVEAFNSSEQVFDMINSFVNSCSDFVDSSSNLRSNV